MIARSPNLNATGVPILLTIQSLSKMGAIIDFSTGASFFPNLTDTVFVQLEQEANGHLYLSPVKDMLSQSICDEDQLLGFQAAARVLENLGKKRTGLSVCTRRRRGTGERTMSARNPDESGGDSSHVCFVLSDNF